MTEQETRVMMHWNYLLLLEEDCMEIFKYIEPCSKNGAVYGPEIAKLLLACGSEVDVVLKELFECVDPVSFWKQKKSGSGFSKQLNINDYREFVRDSRESQFKDVSVGMVSNNWQVSPWRSWWYAEPKNPVWWKSYNDVKHNRGERVSSGYSFCCFFGFDGFVRVRG